MNFPSTARMPGKAKEKAMKAFQRLADGDVRVAAAFTVTIAAVAVNYAFADDMGYNWKTGAIILPFATYYLGKCV